MALFSLSATCLLPPASVTAPDNKAIRSLVVTRPVSKRGLAPLGLRLAANWRAALTTTMWMVAWVHSRSTNNWTAAHVARTPGLTDAAVLVVNIPHLTDRS
jgi:hypothetical protein